MILIVDLKQVSTPNIILSIPPKSGREIRLRAGGWDTTYIDHANHVERRGTAHTAPWAA